MESLRPWRKCRFQGFDGGGNSSVEKGKSVDPFVVISYLNAGLALVSNVLSLAGQAAHLALTLL